MKEPLSRLSRRRVFQMLGAGSAAMAASRWLGGASLAQDPQRTSPLESFTGPGANPHWNSVGPYFTEPQKAPLLLLTDRPVQLETPRHYFLSAFTPNEAFYVARGTSSCNLRSLRPLGKPR